MKQPAYVCLLQAHKSFACDVENFHVTRALADLNEFVIRRCAILDWQEFVIESQNWHAQQMKNN